MAKTTTHNKKRSSEMNKLISIVFCAAFLKLFAATAHSQPVISALSASSLARSGRLLISGSGFGAAQGSSSVRIGAVTALVTHWSDTLITAYVPETTPTGNNEVEVITGSGSSNLAPLAVTLRQPSGRVKWRFQADAPYFFHRPAIGSDGTIIAHDASGFVYALSPEGGLKWIYPARTFASGPPSIGADGSVYLGNSTTVTALNGDGTLKWVFTNPGGRSLAAGPTVGPDGKIYAYFNPVVGVYAFTPAGEIAWTYSSPNLLDLFEYGVELAFGPSLSGHPADQLYLSFGVAPTGYLWSLKMATGALAFALPMARTWDSLMQPQGQAVTAPDGTIYTACNVAIGSSTSVNAFNPDGSVKWKHDQFGGISAPDLGPNGNVYFVYQAGHLGAVDANGISLWNVFDGINSLQYPIANPAGGMVFVGGGVNGSPGFVRAYDSANGAILWQLDLGSENGGNQWIGSRPRFASDGQTVYFGTTIPTASADSYCYLYAVDASGAGSAPVLSALTISPASVTVGTPSTGRVTLSGPAPSGGAAVALARSKPLVVTVPASVMIPAGATSATFSVATKPVPRSTSASISATYGAVTKTAVLTVNPQAGADTVAIQTAEYLLSRQQLKIAATSTSATATLKAFVTSTDALIGKLSHVGGGSYRGQFAWPINPLNVTVRSSLGGSAKKDASTININN
jgi:hypothetical protein